MKEAKGFPYVDDIYLFNTGNARRAYEVFGCHYLEDLKKHRFCVWAPNARSVSVVGDFNGWNPQAGYHLFYGYKIRRMQLDILRRNEMR